MSTLSTLISAGGGGGGGSLPIGASIDLLHNTTTVQVGEEVFLKNGTTASPATYPDSPARSYMYEGHYQELGHSTLVSPWGGGVSGEIVLNGCTRDDAPTGQGTYYWLNNYGNLYAFSDEGTSYKAMRGYMHNSVIGSVYNVGFMGIVPNTAAYGARAGDLCIFSADQYKLHFFNPTTLATTGSLQLLNGNRYVSGSNNSAGVLFDSGGRVGNFQTCLYSGGQHEIREHSLSTGNPTGWYAFIGTGHLGSSQVEEFLPYLSKNAGWWGVRVKNTNTIHWYDDTWAYSGQATADPSNTHINAIAPHLNSVGTLSFVQRSQNTIAYSRGYHTNGWAQFLPSAYTTYAGFAYDGSAERYFGVVDNQKAYPITYTGNVIGTPIDMSAQAAPFRFASDGTHLYNLNGTNVHKYDMSNQTFVSTADISGKVSGTDATGIAYNSGNSSFYVLDKTNSQVHVYNAIWVWQSTITLSNSPHATETLVSLSIGMNSLWVLTDANIHLYDISGTYLTIKSSGSITGDMEFYDNYMVGLRISDARTYSYEAAVNVVGHPSATSNGITTKYTRVK